MKGRPFILRQYRHEGTQVEFCEVGLRGLLPTTHWRSSEAAPGSAYWNRFQERGRAIQEQSADFLLENAVNKIEEIVDKEKPS